MLTDALWGNNRVFDRIAAEAARAAEKHGIERTPYSGQTFGEKMLVLTEEVGEVARACTYDESDRTNRITELIQLATMAALWAAWEIQHGE